MLLVKSCNLPNSNSIKLNSNISNIFSFLLYQACYDIQYFRKRILAISVVLSFFSCLHKWHLLATILAPSCFGPTSLINTAFTPELRSGILKMGLPFISSLFVLSEWKHCLILDGRMQVAATRKKRIYSNRGAFSQDSNSIKEMFVYFKKIYFVQVRYDRYGICRFNIYMISL